MSDSIKKALCCTCGNLRTFRRSRNHREEKYWFSGTVDLDWHRETGDLKCKECNRVTTHALLHPEGSWEADHAEMMQRVATGNSHGHFTSGELDNVRRKYRQGLPRNPFIRHFWWGSEAQEIWDAGGHTVIGLCGEPMAIHRDPSGPSSKKRADEDDDDQIRPKEIREQEYEDEATGLWWTETHCVDCLRVWHLELLRRRRDVLIDKATRFLAELLEDKTNYPKKIDLATVNNLIETIESAHRRDVKNQDITR